MISPLYPLLMAECDICGKKVPAGSNTCSIQCLQTASQQDRSRSFAARSAFSESMRKMHKASMERELSPQLEVPMLKVRHRWMRNRTVVAGSVVIPFNHEGIASIPDMGNNRGAVEFFVKKSKGLVKWVEEEVEKTPEPKKSEPPKVEVEVETKVKEEKVEEKQLTFVDEPVVTDEDVEEEEKKPKRRSYKKSAPKRKPVGKKSK